MGADGTSDETDRIDHERRRALALFGLWAAAAFLAPVLLKPLPAFADGDDGHGDDDDDEGGHGDSGETRTGSGGPPEAP